MHRAPICTFSHVVTCTYHGLRWAMLGRELLHALPHARSVARLVRKRVHAGQASLRRSDVQESFQRRVALREIERVAPNVDAEGAWRAGARKDGGSSRALVALLRVFERRYGRDWGVRKDALKALVR